MDASNLRLIKRIIPDDPQDKICLMMSFAGSSRDVSDPWYTGDFEATYRDILSACKAMLLPFPVQGLAAAPGSAPEYP